MAGLGIAVYTDELVSPALAIALRTRGYDALSCHAAGRINQKISDRDQLIYATEHGRAILTNNNGDFAPLDTRWKRQGAPTRASCFMPVCSRLAICCGA